MVRDALQKILADFIMKNLPKKVKPHSHSRDTL